MEQIEYLPVMIFCPVTPLTESMSLKRSALLLGKKESNFLEVYLFDGSLIDVTPGQGKGQKYMI